MRTRSPFVCEEKKRICTTLRFFFSFQPSKCKQASTSTSKTISKFHWCKAIEMTAICLCFVLPCQCVCTDSFIIHSWFTIIIVHAMSHKKNCISIRFYKLHKSSEWKFKCTSNFFLFFSLIYFSVTAECCSYCTLLICLTKCFYWRRKEARLVSKCRAHAFSLILISSSLPSVII